MKKLTKSLCLVLALLMIVSIIPMQTQAAPKISLKSKTVYVGDSFYLKMSGTTKKVTWSSSNKKVATVNKYGRVTAKKAGKATIKAKVSSKYYKCTVTVKAIPTEKDLTWKEYTKHGYFGDSTYRYIEVTNNSKETITVKTKSTAYDVDGNLIGAAESGSEVIGPGCTSLVYEYYDSTTGIVRFDTKFKVELSNFYRSVIEDLEYTYSVLDGKILMQVTNNGSHRAEFVEAYLLFFKNGELVNVEEKYFDGEESCYLYPDETATEQINLYDDVEYDEIKVFLTGRASK